MQDRQPCRATYANALYCYVDTLDIISARA